MTKQNQKRKVREAAVEYIVDRREEAVTTISSKNQVTLPAHLVRELGLQSGDRLAVTLEGSRIVLRPRPKDWVGYHAGALAGLYGRDRKAVDAYVEKLRADTGRDAEIERAWAGRKPAADG